MSRRPVGVRVVGFPAFSGYGDATTQHINALSRAGVPVDFVPLVSGSKEWGPRFDAAPLASGMRLPDDPSAGHVRSGVDCDTLLVSASPEYIARALDELGPTARRVLHLAWETDLVRPAYVELINRYDLVLAPCRQNAEAFSRSGVTVPIEVVPHVARTIEPGAPLDIASVAGRYCFYTIGSWSARKAMVETMRAFLDEFTSADSVAMVIKTGDVDHIALYQHDRASMLAPFHGRVWWTVAQILREYPDPPPVHLICDPVSPRQIDALHGIGDCFVSLTHGEGWGLGAFDAGIAGNVVIIGRWGGPDDYLPADWPLSPRYELMRACDSPLDSWTQPSAPEHWALVDETDAQQMMRWVYEHQDDAGGLGTALQAHLTSTFDVDVIGDRLVSVLSAATPSRASARRFEA